MHKTAGVPNLPINIQRLINSAKAALAKARLEQDKEKAEKFRSIAFEKIDDARDALRNMRLQAPESQQAHERFDLENIFFQRFSRHPTDPIDLYRELKLSRQKVIELEKARLAQNKQAGYFMPDWKIKQIIDKTLELLGFK